MHKIKYMVVLMAGVLLAGCPPKKNQGDREIRTTELPPIEVRADDPGVIQYTLRFPMRASHYVDVEGIFPAGADSIELSMAVWTPGSYMVREYSRHMEGLSAATVDGRALHMVKLAKNRWRVDSKDTDKVVVRYRLYCHEPSVRTNYVNDELAVLNGAATFLALAGNDHVQNNHVFDIAIELPEGWKHSVTALDAHEQGQNRYVAPDFDTLVDSPIVAGNPAIYEFEIEGIKHGLVNFGEGTAWDGPRSARDTETLARTQAAFWGTIPYRRYVFLNVLSDGMGASGLEHKASTLMMASRWMTRKRESYQGWLGLVSHEFFHTWNIKRLRPHTLGPFDYESENYTRSLWIAEGITSYYDDLLLARAGLLDEEDYLKKLSGQIETVQSTPGRKFQSLADSSFDAWIKFYRPDENSSNTQINYYSKGAVVGFLLDAEIRRATQNRRSLDDVMRLAYERFAGERGYTPEEFRAVAAEVAGRPLDEFFARAVDSTDELDYEPALAFYGLRFVDADDTDKKDHDGGKKDEKDKEPAGYLGVEIASDNEITKVRRDSPAFAAGLSVEDELIAIDDYRVANGALVERLERYRPGDRVSVLVSRRGQMRTVDATLGKKPESNWKLATDAKAGQLPTSRRQRWLAGETVP